MIKVRERTRHLKMWHDHSDILNHTYVHFMVSFLYDTGNFLSNEEYKEHFPDRKPINVQTIVERPNLHILGQSGTCYVEIFIPNKAYPN